MKKGQHIRRIPAAARIKARPVLLKGLEKITLL
jgi:hypothetical protein